jgi:hypothetical protein
MEIQPVNLTDLLSAFMALSLLLVPVIGMTVRFAAKPLVDALLQSGLLTPRAQLNDSELGRLSRRVLELEQELERRKLEPISAMQSSSGPAELRRVHT